MIAEWICRDMAEQRRELGEGTYLVDTLEHDQVRGEWHAAGCCLLAGFVAGSHLALAS